MYYELFLAALDQLTLLEAFLVTMGASGTPLVDIYASVAHAPHVVPRLYLQTAVASAYVRSGQMRAPPILAELVEAAVGVQHPLRGLFVRYFIAQRLRDRLPEAAPPLPGAPPPTDGSILDSLRFLLSVLRDMNTLWVRMGAVSGAGVVSALAPSGGGQSASGGSGCGGGGEPAAAAPRGRKRRERERLELRVLVGSILSRISSLEALSLPVYATEVLPAVLKTVIDCADGAAQAYLLDSALAVFPAEWHAATLDVSRETGEGGVRAGAARAGAVVWTRKNASSAHPRPHFPPRAMQIIGALPRNAKPRPAARHCEINPPRARRKDA